MSSRTTNYNLIKPDITEKALIGDINNNMDTIDAALAAKANSTELSSVEDGLAILANGNTHAAIASGQAVFVRNHSSLANGLYWAKAAIAQNAALSTSNLEADDAGGLNALKADIDTLNSNMSINGAYSRLAWLTDSERGSDGGVSVCYNGTVISVDVLTANISHSTDQVIGTIPEGYRPLYNANFVGYCNGSPCIVRIKLDGGIVIWHMANSATGRLYFHARYFYK